MDTLAQVLTLSNLQADSKVLLVETCQGLLAGAILDRLTSMYSCYMYSRRVYFLSLLFIDWL